MGEIVGAGLVAHAPTIMLPQDVRYELNEGEEITLVTGLREMREQVFDNPELDYDTVVVFDSHWATTVEYVIAAHHHRAGLYTSEELPRGMCRVRYDFPGDPELARNTAKFAEKHGTWITPNDDPYLPIHYATVNLWHYLGVPGKRWMSVGCCQTADVEDNLRLGRALADAIAETDRKVLLVASGALSHTFWNLRELRDHEASHPSHVRTPEARKADEDRLGWMAQGDHAQILRTMPDFMQYKPEARFGHYLMMLGALGEERCAAPGRMYGTYENATGTGQAHMWFDRPAAGWTS